MVKIEKQKIVYKNKKIYPAFPSMITLNNGNFFVSFRYAPTEEEGYSHLHSLSKIKTLELDNDFKVVREFDLCDDDEAAKQDTGFFRLSEQQILAYYFRYSFHPECEKALFEKSGNTYIHSENKKTIASLDGVGLSISEDFGQTFSLYRIMTLDGHSKHFAIRGSMCRVGEKILASVYAYKSKNKYQCIIVESENGLNWKKRSLLCQTAVCGDKRIEYVEPSLCYIENHNIIVAFIRSHVTNKGETNVYTSLAFSYDEGVSFTKPILTNIEGHPMHPLVVGDKIALIYGYRKQPYGVRMVVLDAYELIRSKCIDNIDNNNSSEVVAETIIEDKMISGDCGYPWALYDEKSNSVVCCYYGAYKDNVRLIKAVRLAL